MTSLCPSSCPGHSRPSPHLIIRVMVSPVTTEHPTKARTISCGNHHRYETNAENAAPRPLKLEEPSVHLLPVKLGVFLETCGSLSFRFTFLGRLAGCSTYSIKFNFPSPVTSRSCQTPQGARDFTPDPRCSRPGGRTAVAAGIALTLSTRIWRGLGVHASHFHQTCQDTSYVYTNKHLVQR